MKLKRSAFAAAGALAALVAVLAGAPLAVHAHCQIPCGIYDDALRFALLNEHITTIEKSMSQINELSADPGKNANQIARWVINKEDHAGQFADIVVAYFLQQRIKPLRAGLDDTAAYATKLRLCHEMLVHTMKAKQTTDLQHTEKLAALVGEFHAAYFGVDADHAKSHEGSQSR